MKFGLCPIKPKVLAARVIARVDEALKQQFGLEDEEQSLGLITVTSDDALYVALDEGTKAAAVRVVYARSFYAGSAHASGPLSGEVIGIYAGRDPADIHAALHRCQRHLESEACFYAADAAGQLTFFPHVISSLGHYLSKESGLPIGAPMAYLIAPPLESIVGLDAALKVASVELVRWFGPPTETNFGGAYLAGTLPDVEAAARAFAAAILDVAAHPIDLHRNTRGAGEDLAQEPSSPDHGPFRVLATGERLTAKPEHLTHLRDDESLVEKTHPRIVLRGKMELLQAALLDCQVAADAEHARQLVGELGEVLELSRTLVGAEVTGKPLGPWKLLGLDADAIRWTSHHTFELYRVPFLYPDVRQGPVVAKLSFARALAREAELAALTAFRPHTPSARDDLVLVLNRTSSLLYVMICKYVGQRYDGRHKLSGPLRGWRPPQQ